MYQKLSFAQNKPPETTGKNGKKSVAANNFKKVVCADTEKLTYNLRFEISITGEMVDRKKNWSPEI